MQGLNELRNLSNVHSFVTNPPARLPLKQYSDLRYGMVGLLYSTPRIQLSVHSFELKRPEGPPARSGDQEGP